MPAKKTKPGRKTGRPSGFTVEIGDAICERLIAGQSLRTICRDEGMPNASTVLRWVSEREEFCKQYARAREAQADTLAEEALEIADDARNDWMEVQGEDAGAGWRLNGEHIQRSRLRVEQRRWYAGKLRPKVYGDKVSQEIGGPNGGPIQHSIKVTFG